MKVGRRGFLGGAIGAALGGQRAAEAAAEAMKASMKQAGINPMPDRPPDHLNSLYGQAQEISPTPMPPIQEILKSFLEDEDAKAELFSLLVRNNRCYQPDGLDADLRFGNHSFSTAAKLFIQTQRNAKRQFEHMRAPEDYWHMSHWELIHHWWQSKFGNSVKKFFGLYDNGVKQNRPR